jgi:hypothetical protein
MLRRLASAHGVELSTEAIYPVTDGFHLPGLEELSSFEAVAAKCTMMGLTEPHK